MFDATYFRSKLPAHAKDAGAEPTVEVHLDGGQTHRVRSVREVTDGYVVLDVHHRRSEVTGAKTHWVGGASPEKPAADVFHAVISYESISQVLIVPTDATAQARIGFGAT